MVRTAALLRALALVGSCLACAAPKSFQSAVSQSSTAVGSCDMPVGQGLLDLGGSAAGACNAAQAVYAGLSSGCLGAYAARCHCVDAYYNKAKTLADVDLWTTCVGPPNIMIVTCGKMAVDYMNAHAKDIFASCQVCTDAKFPKVPDDLEQVQTVLEVVLDWRGKLLESEENMLKEGVQSVVTSALVGDGVPGGKPSPTVDFVVSTITKGGTSGSSSGSNKAALEARAANSANTTNAPISDLITVQIKLLLVPVNVTVSSLQDQVKKVVTSSAFAGNLTQWNANLTSAAYNQVRGDQSVNATSTGSSTASATTSVTAASASTTPKGAASTLAPLSTFMVLALTFCFVQAL